MAMTILNNTAANLTLGELNRNISRVGKDLKKVATGQKINSAADDASGYGISERMRVQIRSLEQDIQNVQNGSALLKIASGGIEDIVEELRTIKELAINSANDSNTDEDRKTIQKTFKQKIANIDDIATTTNYNTKTLIDGTYENFMQKFYSMMNIESSYEKSTTELEAEAKGESTVSSNYSWTSGAVDTIIEKLINQNSSSASEPTEVKTIGGSTGALTITEDGVYNLSSGALTGTLTISGNAKNVKLVGSGDISSGNNTNGFHIINESATDLWLENVNVTSGINSDAVLKFSSASDETDRTLHLIGDNSINSTKSGNSVSNGGTGSATVEVGENVNLSIEGSDGSLSINMAGRYGAGIGSAEAASCGNLTIGAGVTINITKSGDGGGAGIGSGAAQTSRSPITKASCGDITIGYGATVNINLASSRGAGIGAGSGGSTCGNIYIYPGSEVTSITAPPNANTNNNGAGIGTGAGSTDGGEVGDIIIYSGAKVNTTSIGDAAAIGTGRNTGSNSVGNIIIYSGAEINAETQGAGAEIGAGGTNSASYGDITIYGNSIINAEVIGAAPGYNSTGGAIDKLNSIVYDFAGNLQPNDYLAIQSGTRANERINIYINDMHTKSMGLDAADLTTREKAVNSISVIRTAIEYALDEATNVGAYLRRMEFTESNLVISDENAQSAESTIRDADMAKAMTSYTKNNVLLQASQSMLAQANQNSSGILSLLQ